MRKYGCGNPAGVPGFYVFDAELGLGEMAMQRAGCIHGSCSLPLSTRLVSDVKSNLLVQPLQD